MTNTTTTSKGLKRFGIRKNRRDRIESAVKAVVALRLYLYANEMELLEQELLDAYNEVHEAVECRRALEAKGYYETGNGKSI